MVKGNRMMRMFLYCIAFMSLAATGVLAHMDYAGKIHDWCMLRHLTWQTWTCFVVFVTSYAWAKLLKEKS